MKAEGFEVTSLALEDTLRTRLYKKVLYKLGRRRGDITRYPIFMKERQRKIVQALQNEKFDAIFAVGSIDAAAIPEDVGTPVYFYTDGTMAIMKGYYPSFSQWDSMTLRYAEKAEQKAVDVVKKSGGGGILTSSEWCNRSFIQDYGVPESLTHMVRIGSNHMAHFSEQDIRAIICNRVDTIKSGLNLLFVGVDWERKGGVDFLRLCELLKEHGVPFHGAIAGCNPSIPSSFPVWYFQGIQEMRFITVFNLIARTASVIAIFAFVNQKADYCLAAFLQSITPVLAGMISLFVLHRKTPELFLIPSWLDIKKKLKNGWDIFISTVFISLYTNSNVFILGIMTNDTIVGYYAAANKLIMAVNGLMGPISSAIFPHVSALFKESREKAILFLRKTVRYIGGLSFLASLGTFVLAEPIVHIIMGSAYEESILILRILSFFPFVVALSNIFGVQTMVTFGMQNIFSRILMFSALLNFALIFPLIYFWQGTGLSITVMLVESFVTIVMYLVLRKNKIRLLG